MTPALGFGRRSLGAAATALLLPPALVGTAVVDLAATTARTSLRSRAGRHALPQTRCAERARGEGVNEQRHSEHRLSVTIYRASRGSGHGALRGGTGGGGWFTNAPPAAPSGGGAVDQLGAEGWIRGRAPLKHPRLRARARACL